MQSISIWLIPQKKQKEQLQKIINDLAVRYQAYPFLPLFLIAQLTLDKLMIIQKPGGSIVKETDVLDWKVVYEL